MRREPLVLALLLAACHHAAPEGEEEAAPAPRVKCVPVEKRALATTIELRGTVSPLPERDAEVAPIVAGRIAAVNVHEGDRVSQGQVVAAVEAAPLQTSVNEAQAVLARAKAERENARTSLERLQRTLKEGISTQQEVDDAAARFAATNASVEEAQAGVERATRNLTRAEVQSPLAGVVLRIQRHPGELVDGTGATPILEVGDPAVLDLVCDATAADLVQLSRGAPARLFLSAFPNRELTGHVSLLSPAVDRVTGLGTVRVRLDHVAPVSPPVGSSGLARIASEAAHDALVVPPQALRAAIGAHAQVVVCGEKEARVVEVERGETLPDAVEIRSGLSGNEQVAVAPVLGLTDGESIEVVK